MFTEVWSRSILYKKAEVQTSAYLSNSGFFDGPDGKELPAMQETQVRSLGWEYIHIYIYIYIYITGFLQVTEYEVCCYCPRN